MWMMGYSDGGEFNMPDSFNGRKLRPLIPRPLLSANNNSTTTPPPCLSRLHGTDLFSQYHHMAVAEQNKREFNTPPVVVSSRWNPTPEQLRSLEELYRRGTRTPSAEQIQHITAQLRRYGKIEGKNVFYWFQNHKARERQKRRRQMETDTDVHHRADIENLERKELGASKTVFEVEQTKNWAPHTNCSTPAEESVSTQKAAKAAAAAVAECRTDGWIQFDQGELQQRRNFGETNATWQMMQLSFCAPPAHLINTPTTLSSAATATTTTAPATARSTIDQKFIKTRDLNIFIAPYRSELSGLNHLNNVSDEFEDDDHGCGGESQTLQLFPLRSSRPRPDGNDNINDKETQISENSANFTPCQFFEFLPLKN